MQDSGSGNNPELSHEQSDTIDSPGTVAVDDADEPGGDGLEPSGEPPESSQAPPSFTHHRTVRLVAYVAAGALAVGVGFGIARVVESSGAGPVISSAIPSPAQGSGAFVEDDDLTAQDNQTNILATTAPGLVHVISGGTAVGIGMVLTPSGKVLTTYQPSGGAKNLTAKYIVAGVTFKARVIGTDAAAGLALLQLEGGDGRAFSTLQVGNSATLISDADKSKQFSYHVAGQVVDTAIGSSGTQDAMTIDVGTLSTLNTTAVVNGKSKTGLIQSVLQSQPTTEIGGPLVNLNGQVIGITVAGAGSGLDISGYAMPINQALAVAAQIDAKSRHTS
jgi:S1-C subfamily serine protease